MAPMDEFCSQHRKQFEFYIDAVCAPVNETNPSHTPETESKRLINGTNGRRPSSAASDSAFTYTAGPLAAMTRRLAPIAREGYLSLPHLIDPARNLAALVDLWLAYASGMHESLLRSAEDDNDSLARFHRLCLVLGQKTRAHATRIDQDASPSSGRIGIALQKWVALAERIEACPELFWRPPAEDAEHDGSSGSITGRKSSVAAGAVLAARPGSSPAVSSDKGKARTSVLLGRTNDKIPEPEGRCRGTSFSLSSGSTRSREKEKGKGKEKEKGKEKGREKGREKGNENVEAPAQASNSDAISTERPSSTSSTHGSATSKRAAKNGAVKRRTSPPRSKEDLALRKLGWI